MPPPFHSDSIKPYHITHIEQNAPKSIWFVPFLSFESNVSALSGTGGMGNGRKMFEVEKHYDCLLLLLAASLLDFWLLASDVVATAFNIVYAIHTYTYILCGAMREYENTV